MGVAYQEATNQPRSRASHPLDLESPYPNAQITSNYFSAVEDVYKFSVDENAREKTGKDDESSRAWARASGVPYWGPGHLSKAMNGPFGVLWTR